MRFSFEHALVNQNEMASSAEVFKPYQEHLKRVIEEKGYTQQESSLCLPDDEKLFKLSEEITRLKTSPALRYIFVIGIGGSNLGTKAIYDAILGHYDNVEIHRSPKLVFLDTTDAEYLERMKEGLLLSELKPNEFLIILISKSGNTLETAVNGEVLFSLIQKEESVRERTVVITTIDSDLWKKAEKENISLLPIPKTVGGRYSVFSPVGIFPLMMCGIDVRNLLKGAQEMRTQCLSGNIIENPAFISAYINLHHYEQGLFMHNTFIFYPALESMGAWYRQLVAESLGKENKTGKAVGIFPTVSLGSTDLHSMGQLYLGGPKLSFTNFISVSEIKTISYPETSLLFDFMTRSSEKNISNILNTILEGTKKTYQAHELPFIETILERVTSYELGKYMMWKMIEIMFLAQGMGVNAFNEPHVASYKAEVKKILKLED